MRLVKVKPLALKNHHLMYSFFEILKSRNELLYYAGGICLMASLACLLLAKVTDVQVLGVNAWFKPFKFYLSSTILLWSMAWYMHYLNEARSVFWCSLLLVLLLGFENVYISVQAARGQLSHFNVSTPFYALMFNIMGWAAVGISMVCAYVAVRFFAQPFPDLPLSYVYSIRMGLVIFVIFSMQGLAMGAKLAHTVGAPDGGAGLPLLNWSRQYGDLRIAHFLGMHALQVLPLLSFYLVRNTKAALAVGLLYAFASVGVLLQALKGRPFWP
jgi:hypothetical protein